MKSNLIVVGLLALLLAMPAMANNYNVVFTNGEDGGAIVGTGTFSFTDNVGDGSYYLNSLGGFSIDFNIGSTTYTNESIDTNLSHVLVNIYGDGSEFYFDSDGEYYGPNGGSLDFAGVNGSFLTTEPNYFGEEGTPLDLYASLNGEGDEFFGTYGVSNGTAAPEPASLVLLGSGLLFTLRRKLRR